MNAEELNGLKSRIAAAEGALRRIARLSEAIGKLDEGVSWLAVPVGDEESIYYTEQRLGDADLRKTQFSRVLVNEEPGLSTAIVEAVRNELARRLQEANSEFHNL